VLELLEPLGKVSHENQMFQYIHLASLAQSYAAAGRFEEAHALLDNRLIAAENRKSGLTLPMDQARASILLIEGKVRDAVVLAEDTLMRSEALQGRHSPNANLCAAIVGDAYYELDRIDDAREVIANRPRILEWSPPEVLIRSAVCRARLDFLQESADTALAFVTSYAAHYQTIGLDRPRAHMLAEQIRILLEIGRRQRANEPAAQLKDLEKRYRDATGSLAEIPAVAESAFVRLYLADGRAADALKSIEAIRRFAEDFGRTRLRARSDIQSAIVLRSMKRGLEALDATGRAVRLGHRLGLARTFIDEGKAAGEALQELHKAKDDLLDAAESEYLETLLGRFGGPREPVVGQRKIEQVSNTGNQFNLTPREVEILKLICHAMPNKRIALALNITLETVKWNVKNILAKLGVSNRYDAITRAREAGLVK
jgi:LuxR family maltose regulon positive regulatory protein